jgi:hypothetical protein
MVTDATIWKPTDEDDGGLGDVEDAISIPRLRLNGKLGVFKLTGQADEQTVRSIRIVPLYHLPHSRALFADSTQPACWSVNGLYPIDQERANQLGAGPTCTTCNYGKWTLDQSSGRRIRPECTESLNLAAATVIEGDGVPLPLIYQAASTSIPPLRNLLGNLERRRLQYPTKRPAFALVVELSAELVRNLERRIEYYRLRAEIVGETEPETWGAYAALRCLFMEDANRENGTSHQLPRNTAVIDGSQTPSAPLLLRGHSAADATPSLAPLTHTPK